MSDEFPNLRSAFATEPAKPVAPVTLPGADAERHTSGTYRDPARHLRATLNARIPGGRYVDDPEALDAEVSRSSAFFEANKAEIYALERMTAPHRKREREDAIVAESSFNVAEYEATRPAREREERRAKLQAEIDELRGRLAAFEEPAE